MRLQFVHSSTAVFVLGDIGWTLYDLLADLDSSKTLVGFTIYGALDRTNYIDDVVLSTSSVSAVPEPGSMALMLAGLAASVPLSRRRHAPCGTARLTGRCRGLK